MTFLDPSSALTTAGSLLSQERHIFASYDLEVSDAPSDNYRPLAHTRAIRNANQQAFQIDYRSIERVHVINGMGVTLGDSIIGLTALSAIQKINPDARFTIYRPSRAPDYVKQLYQLTGPIFGTIVELPVHVDTLPDADLLIDVGNHLFWPNFSSMPMIDFFLWALGVAPGTVSARNKANDWLARIDLPALKGQWKPKEYVLVCPTASTPVRSIPESFRLEVVSRLWDRFHLPVLGFGPIDHERYTDITAYSTDTSAFLAWVRNARYLVTSDTAAVHIAAGFDVPTTAFFTTIPAEMRVRDYPNCTAVDLDVRELIGIQASGRAGDLSIVEQAYGAVRAMDWLPSSLCAGGLSQLT